MVSMLLSPATGEARLCGEGAEVWFGGQDIDVSGCPQSVITFHCPTPLPRRLRWCSSFRVCENSVSELDPA